jgi:4-hydroxythreonine-4-phosphate dehydrogenase
VDISTRPLIAITLGDPAGIGPEICIGCLRNREIYAKVRPFLIGDMELLMRAMRLQNIKIPINVIHNPQDGKYEYGTIDFLPVLCEAKRNFTFGHPTIDAAIWSYNFFVKSIEYGKSGKIDAICTAPINKEMMKKAGFKQTNHTAILHHFFPGIVSTSMFHCRELRVFHFTRHISLRKALDSINTPDLVQSLREANAVMKSIGYKNPRIALAAVNPHASDGGLFGNEENDFLKPAVKLCRKEGIDVSGPIPADAVFYLQKNGLYDCVFAIFHDQALIACKTYDFENTVSLTFGYSFVRSTVDHGTAYDIAGKNIVDSKSMEAAVLTAAYYCRLKKSHQKNNL